MRNKFFICLAASFVPVLFLLDFYKSKSHETALIVRLIEQLNYDEFKTKKSKLEIRQEFLSSTNRFLFRDFFYYECKDRRRIGGILPPDEKLKRKDGAWFVCFDRSVAPVTNDCIVLSFGISTDESFDDEMNTNYGCSVHSFDPFIESNRFQQIRNSNPSLKDSYLIEVNKKWKYYKIGVTGSKYNIKNQNKIGWIDTLENIIQLINLNNTIIDIVKIDIEKVKNKAIIGGEINLLENFDIDYACKYFKQLLIETHAPDIQNNLLYNLLKKLDKCFSLFFRDTRFIVPKYNGQVFEDAAADGYKLNLADFQNEIILSKFLIATGELYFINEYYL